MHNSKGICPLCLNDRHLVSDHDHKTKLFRAEICHDCNVALPGYENNPNKARQHADILRSLWKKPKSSGAFGSNPETLYRVADYLEKGGTTKYRKSGRQR